MNIELKETDPNAAVIQLENFRFNSLRKYMQPLYVQFNGHETKTKEERREIFQKMIPQFFSRLRTYRKISKEELATKSNYPLAEIEEFEDGKLKLNNYISDAYVKFCYGHQELEFFSQAGNEFINAVNIEMRNKLALEVLKQRGIRIPTVDYKNLNIKKGKVLHLP